MTSTQTSTQTPDLTTSTSTQTSTPKDAATMWRDTIQALEAYRAECELSDQLDLESAGVDG